MAIRKIVSRSIGVDVIAAEDLAANSITAAEITNGAVTQAKLSTGAPYWDASSNVGIGTSSPATNLHISSTGTPTLRIQDADGSDYYAQISQATGNTIFDARFGASNGAFIFRGLGGGVPVERMRILSTGGITFNGDTAAANALDDYEEGTFTCTIGYNTSITSATFANATTTVTASYIKIGRMVQVNFPYIDRETTFGGTSVVVFYMTVPFTCGPSNGPGVLLAHYNLSARYTTSVFSTWIPYAQVDVGTNQMRLGSGTYNQTGGGYISLEHSASGMNLGCVYIASA